MPGYRAGLASLFERRRFGMKPTLDVARHLLAALGDPQRRAPAIHITGSKGKGSVAAMCSALLVAHGRRTGLFTSPHLVGYRERMRVDGREIPAEEVVRGLGEIERASERLLAAGTIDRAPTFFEVTTALAFDWFARERVDALVVEVGIGGRWDATNLLASRVGVVTTLELEHTDILGPTIAAIAGEKAGIFHPGMVGVLGDLPEEGADVIAAHARAAGVGLWRPGREVALLDRALLARGQSLRARWPGHEEVPLRLSLDGDFQATNAAIALAAVDRFLRADGEPLRSAPAARALARLAIPGRLERIDRRPTTYVDVAHTPESVRAIVRSLAERHPGVDPRSTAIVFGCLRGKDPARMLAFLAPFARTLVLVPVRSERGLPPSQIRPLAAGRFGVVVLAPSAVAGLEIGRAAVRADGLLLVTGSDYLVGEILRARTPGADREEPDLSDPGRAGPGDPAGAGRP